MMPDDDYPHPLGLHVTENREREAKASLAAPSGSAKSAIKKCCTMGILDRAILCGLGLSADSANIIMEHIEELREEIKSLKRRSPNS